MVSRSQRPGAQSVQPLNGPGCHTPSKNLKRAVWASPLGAEGPRILVFRQDILPPISEARRSVPFHDALKLSLRPRPHDSLAASCHLKLPIVSAVSASHTFAAVAWPTDRLEYRSQTFLAGAP